MAQKEACELRARLREVEQARADAHRELQELGRQVRAAVPEPRPHRGVPIPHTQSPALSPLPGCPQAAVELQDMALLPVSLEATSRRALLGPMGLPVRCAPGGTDNQPQTYGLRTTTWTLMDSGSGIQPGRRGDVPRRLHGGGLAGRAGRAHSSRALAAQGWPGHQLGRPQGPGRRASPHGHLGLENSSIGLGFHSQEPLMLSSPGPRWLRGGP